MDSKRDSHPSSSGCSLSSQSRRRALQTQSRVLSPHQEAVCVLASASDEGSQISEDRFASVRRDTDDCLSLSSDELQEAKQADDGGGRKKSHVPGFEQTRQKSPKRTPKDLRDEESLIILIESVRLRACSLHFAPSASGCLCSLGRPCSPRAGSRSRASPARFDLIFHSLLTCELSQSLLQC